MFAVTKLQFSFQARHSFLYKNIAFGTENIAFSTNYNFVQFAMSGKRCIFAEKMSELNDIYWFGIAAAIYLMSCWMFAAIRWFHTCQAPKESHDYLWPDRRLLVIIYMVSVVLLPYLFNPSSPQAWALWKSYFPGTYYFYGGALFFCFFGTVKRWERWRSTIRTTAAITFVVMLPLLLDAWTAGKVLSEDFAKMWLYVVAAMGVGMMIYCALAVLQTVRWMHEARDENYSNPDDFPMEFARRVWLLPIVMTLFVWPPFVLDSKAVMAVMNVLLAIFNVVMLIFVLPAWRRKSLVPDEELPDNTEVIENLENSEDAAALVEERERKLVEEIEAFVKNKKGYLDAHLKLENVVEHCSYSRSYVSNVFQKHFGGFSLYVNKLRLAHYDKYMAKHPNAIKEAAALESGFTSYNAYYTAKERLAD